MSLVKSIALTVVAALTLHFGSPQPLKPRPVESFRWCGCSPPAAPSPARAPRPPAWPTTSRARCSAKSWSPPCPRSSRWRGQGRADRQRQQHRHHDRQLAHARQPHQRHLRRRPSVAGVVITHGTNTLEETAYFLNLTVKHDRPVVLVGSMRPASAISADGPLNLLNAIRTAVSPDARGKGVLVVLNDDINAARDVTKTNTYRVETFRAPELGLLGYVDADDVTFYRASTQAPHGALRVRRERAHGAAAGRYPLFVRAAEHRAGAGPGRRRRAGHRVCRHGRRPDVHRRARGAEALLALPERRGRCSCDRTAPATAASSRRRTTTRWACAGRQPEPAEGADPADAGADEDPRPGEIRRMFEEY